MFTECHRKVRTEHLQRHAFLYVRQSTARQVLDHTESTRRQYALRDRAVALGWPIEHIHTIDHDQGRSGADSKARDGFQYLVSEVALGHAGIVLGLEASRLARNNADWQRLLELCALSGCLVGDEDGVYDPTHCNDRLLLGLKGAISEAELHMLKARLIGGQRNKAQRGALEIPLPIGLVYDAAGAVVLDPDPQIQASVRRLFDVFREMRSATAVEKRSRHEGWQFPRRLRRGIGKGQVIFGPLDQSRITDILHNPRYAGAFAYGRWRAVRKPGEKQVVFALPREQWQVLIRNAHPGYISWEEFEANEATLAQNRQPARWRAPPGTARQSEALLQGRILCGVCGARMRVDYDPRNGERINYYACEQRPLHQPRSACRWIRAQEIDAAVGALLLQTVTSATLHRALAVHDQIMRRLEREEAQQRKQLEQVRQACELKRQRFLSCDPDHRLVANALEADWNEALGGFHALQREQEQQRLAQQARLDEESRAKLMALSEEFPRAWNDSRTPVHERKRMLAQLIEDVTLFRGDPIILHVRFRGGHNTSLHVPRRQAPPRANKVPSEVIQQLDRLLEICCDREAAERLNALGYRNWQSQPFTTRRVIQLRERAGLSTRFERLRAQGFLTAREMALQLKICVENVYHLGRKGVLPQERYGRDHRCLFAPLNGAVFGPGHGGRYRATQPRLVAADQSSGVIKNRRR